MATSAAVRVRREPVVLPTYRPQRPDRNPMFLEKRVYQGSSGRVYPLPVIDRIAEQPQPEAWDAIVIENEFLLVLILPGLGGRIHRIQDKTNGYDAIYYQPVIKPALVGLAGPWCSGGIEFNWPQHHRPSTFMPADVAIEHHGDGAATVWLSEHDPMSRMKGMHGVRLHPGRSCVELVARAYNRTPDVQTFLWWANVATRVHEEYKSFFPPDATCVADHARRAMSTFPRSSGRYYGVDYAARGRRGVPAAEVPRLYVPPHCRPGASNGRPHPEVHAYRPDDLSWYANIPVPTSYMCVGSSGNFSGGYDYTARAGLIHVANHHISPGKKQWTWGNQEFGYAWDRNLTDADGGEFPPYVELMAGVYTDNQPDFSFLQPGETKWWSQFWYPIRAIGPADCANAEAAVSLRLAADRAILGVSVTGVHPVALVRLETRGRLLRKWRTVLCPRQPFVAEMRVPAGTVLADLTLRVLAGGRELIVHAPAIVTPAPVPPAATEPPAPEDTRSADELFVIGLHLEQYRHVTRQPEDYWREALRRDPGDSRCNLALGRWHLRRGELAEAEEFLRASLARLVSRNPNPSDGEASYQLGRCLRLQAFAAAPPDRARLDAAYAAFYKAAWNHAWQPASYHALAEIDCLRGEFAAALDHLDRALRLNADNLRARDLKAVVLRRLGRAGEADALLAETLALDPLDWWARFLAGQRLGCDNQVRLDLALDCVRAGLFDDALALLADPATPPAAGRPDASWGTAPLVHYYRAWIHQLRGQARARRAALAAARRADPDFCFPARVEEIAILEQAIAADPRDARAPFFLGHLLYDRRRHPEAIRHWECAVRLEPGNAVAWRNLGLARHNILRDPRGARAAYERAFAAQPGDARLLYERDQLWKRLGASPADRRRELLRHRALVDRRDDLSIELGALHLQTGEPAAARAIVTSRRFQPWEGGEGQALGLHVRTHLALGRQALRADDAGGAITHFSVALQAPENLGEARHLLANAADIHYWLGCAHAAAGHRAEAEKHWRTSAGFTGDFQGMSVRTYSEMTYFSARALQRLGRLSAATRLLKNLLQHARALAAAPAKIDYFATSLPTMLLFDDDLTARQHTTALFLEAQARLGLGETAAGRRLLRTVLQRDPNFAPAADLLGDTAFRP